MNTISRDEETVVVFYRGGRIGRFTVLGECRDGRAREYYFSIGSREQRLPLSDARVIVANSPAEFMIVEPTAPKASRRSTQAPRQRPLQAPPSPVQSGVPAEVLRPVSTPTPTLRVSTPRPKAAAKAPIDDSDFDPWKDRTESPLVRAIRSLLSPEEGIVSYTVSELLDRLNELGRVEEDIDLLHPDWPRSARSLGWKLRGLVDELRWKGIVISFRREARRRYVVLSKVRLPASLEEL